MTGWTETELEDYRRMVDEPTPDENLGDCVWCFQPASGPRKKAVTRVWSSEWACVCKTHKDAIEQENQRELSPAP